MSKQWSKENEDYELFVNNPEDFTEKELNNAFKKAYEIETGMAYQWEDEWVGRKLHKINGKKANGMLWIREGE